MTTPLLDKVITAIKDEVGAVSAKTCKSVIAGVLSLAVRHGAIVSNPVRELDSIEAAPKKAPRALSDQERQAWFAMLAGDERANRADIPDLSLFLLATGLRISESLAVLWEQVDFEAREVEITAQINRVPGVGLVRRRTKSRAGLRVLSLPSWAMAMLQRRFSAGVRLEAPIFADALGGFRDPNNVRTDLRRARQPIGGELRRELGRELQTLRREAGLLQAPFVHRCSTPLLERVNPRSPTSSPGSHRTSSGRRLRPCWTRLGRPRAGSRPTRLVSAVHDAGRLLRTEGA